MLAAFNGLAYLGHEFMNSVRDDESRRFAIATADSSDPDEPIVYMDSRGRTREAKTQKQVSYIKNARGELCLVYTKTGHYIYNYDKVKRDKINKKNKELAEQEGKIFYTYETPEGKYFRKVNDDNSLFKRETIIIRGLGFPHGCYDVFVNILTGEVDPDSIDIERTRETFICNSKLYGKNRKQASELFDSEINKEMMKFKEYYVGNNYGR